MSKLVCGIGINDADYAVQSVVNGRRSVCPAHQTWYNMLRRAYSAKLHEKRPTYVGVKVAEEWKHFMSFRAWWLDHQVDEWALDKDLLTNSNTYSPDSCIFVPPWLNAFTIDCGASRGDLPIGVSWHKQRGKYQAHCRHPFGRQEHLGLFECPEQAHLAWMSRKLEMALELKPKMDDIDKRIYPRVVDIIRSAR